MTAVDLFEKRAEDYYRRHAPLASRMRPRTLDEFVGQDDSLGEGRPIRRMIETDNLVSLILWGPPGTGKTTLAKIVADLTGRAFVSITAISSGVKEVRRIIADARDDLAMHGRGTILFVDEIHRFNKAQQDAFLKSIEEGTITLIGATTENPSFQVNNAILSRCQVVVFKHFTEDEVRDILERAAADSERGLARDGSGITVDEEAIGLLAHIARGDARVGLNLLELAAIKTTIDGGKNVTAEAVRQAAGKEFLLYDRAGEEHFNLISALHKSLRGSDPDAGLYYLARMLEGGEDPLYVIRRLVRFASEDVGNADPQALALAISAQQAVHFLGTPECDTALAQLVVYLALAPKSNSAYEAINLAKEEIADSGHLPVPLVIRNAPTSMMKDLGYGEGYRYVHDFDEKFVPDEYLPDEIRGKKFYTPGKLGFEKELAKRIAYFEKLRGKLKAEETEGGGENQSLPKGST